MPRPKKEIKKIKKNDFDLSKFDATLNFAYCPSEALTLTPELKHSTEEFKQLSKDLDERCTKYLAAAMKYFYVCYCIKIENFNNEENHYLYFQLFSQVGDQQSAALPIYGFYSYESILSIIKDIDSMFLGENYNKQVFDTFQNELYGTADQIIKLMQDWTSLKLLSFNEMYFKNQSAVESLSYLIKYGKKILNKSSDKKTTKKRIAPKKKVKAKLEPKNE